MPFCRECGKEVQDDWVTCPYCSAPTGVSDSQVSSIKNSPSKPIQITSIQESSNKGVWNAIVVCITVAILMWPHGVLGITLLDRATANCEVLDVEWLDMEEECVEWKESGIVYVALLIGVALLFLANINKSSRSHKGSFEYQPDDWGGGALKPTNDKEGSSSDESPQVYLHVRKEKTEDEIIRQTILLTKFLTIIAIIALYATIQHIPLFNTLSIDETETSREKSSLNYLLNCNVDAEIIRNFENVTEEPDRYCTQKAQDQAGAIQTFLLVLACAGILLISISKLNFLNKSDEEEESEEESNHSPLDSNH